MGAKQLPLAICSTAKRRQYKNKDYQQIDKVLS
jgi:hypothetical protein